MELRNRIKEVLVEEMSSKALDVVKNVSLFLLQLRKPTSHTKTMTINEVIKSRAVTIELLNNVIVELY